MRRRRSCSAGRAFQLDAPAFAARLARVRSGNFGDRKFSVAASLGRESLYKTLSAQGNPEFKTLEAILSALGMRFSVVRAEASPEIHSGETHTEVMEEALQPA